jgi:hypothetical protein
MCDLGPDLLGTRGITSRPSRNTVASDIGHVDCRDKLHLQAAAKILRGESSCPWQEAEWVITLRTREGGSMRNPSHFRIRDIACQPNQVHF